MSKIIKVWTCEQCVQPKPCGRFSIFDEDVSYGPVGCNLSKDGDVVPDWRLTTRYKITELPAIWIVNIPWGEINKTNIEGAFYLREYDGEEITDLTFDFHGTGMVMHEESEVAFPPEWLTQKQPETGENLQKRLDSILYTAKQEDHFHPWRIKRIIKIANGES